MMQLDQILARFFMIELGAVKCIGESYHTARFHDGGGEALHVLVFSITLHVPRVVVLLSLVNS